MMYGALLLLIFLFLSLCFLMKIDANLSFQRLFSTVSLFMGPPILDLQTCSTLMLQIDHYNIYIQKLH